MKTGHEHSMNFEKVAIAKFITFTVLWNSKFETWNTKLSHEKYIRDQWNVEKTDDKHMTSNFL